MMYWLPRLRPGSLLRVSVLVCTAAAAVMLSSAGGVAHPGTTGVTWSDTTERILQARCVGCHGPAGVARPRLDQYEEARAASLMIKRTALRGHPRRWYAVPGFGDFGNDPTLTPHEIEMLAQWADGRAPRGSRPPSRAKPVRAAHSAKPALQLRVPAKHRIRAASHMFDLPTHLDREAWIRGWVFEPGHAALVTGAVIALRSGMTIGTWSPGDTTVWLPEGAGYRLPAQSSLRLTVYYAQPDGPAVDASRVGLYLGSRPAHTVEQMTLPCGSVRLERSIEALAVRPVPATPGESLTVIARRPDRSVEPLGWFQHYPADHTQTYRFREPVWLPQGTSLDVGARAAACGAELEYVAANAPSRWTAAPRAAETVDVAGAEYWCPMHADVRAAAGGTCDRCGMPLVPVTPRVEGAYWLDAELEPRGLQPGEPGTLRLVVREPHTRLVVRQFEEVHEKRFHLFVVSDDLQEFSHVHPVAQPDGSLTLPLTMRRAGSYRLFADFLPVGVTPQMIARTVIVGAPKRTAGAPGARPLSSEPAVETADGVRVRLHYESGMLVAGDPSLLAFTLEDAATGLPVSDLEPYLGAWGHMFITGTDLSRAVHSHPTAPLSIRPGSRIYFNQRFPKAGTYRLWAQFQRAGSVATVTFLVNVVDRFSIT